MVAMYEHEMELFEQVEEEVMPDTLASECFVVFEELTENGFRMAHCALRYDLVRETSLEIQRRKGIGKKLNSIMKFETVPDPEPIYGREPQ